MNPSKKSISLLIAAVSIFITSNTFAMEAEDEAKLEETASHLYVDSHFSGRLTIEELKRKVDVTLAQRKSVRYLHFYNEWVPPAEYLSDLLKRHRNLYGLELHGCPGSAMAFKVLQQEGTKLDNLTRLNLLEAIPSRRGAEALLTTCSNLEELDAHDCPTVTEALGYSTDYSLPNLRKLHISYSGKHRLSRRHAYQIFTTNKALEDLGLPECNDAANVLLDLDDEELLDLTKLDLSGTNLDSNELRAILIKYKNLKEISLNYCKHAAEALLDLGAGSLPNLKKISLQATSVTPEVAEAILNACPGLQELDLNGYTGVAEAFVAIKQQLPYLKILSLNNTQTTARQLNAILHKCQNLQVLRLGHCKNSVKEFLGWRANSFPQLQELNLNYTEATQAQVSALLRACPNLRYLYLYDTQAICAFSQQETDSLPHLLELGVGLYYGFKSDNAKRKRYLAILKACPNLKKLFLRPADINDGEIETLHRAFPHCKIE